MPPSIHYGFVCAHDFMTHRSRGPLEQVYSLGRDLRYGARGHWVHCWHTAWLAPWRIRTYIYVIGRVFPNSLEGRSVPLEK